MLAHGLVVVAVDRQAFTEEAGDPGAGSRLHLDRTELVTARAVPLVTDQVRRVLVELPARVHGHHLHAATNPEDRQPDRGRGVEQRDLPAVPVGAPLGGPGMRFGAVPGRVDVGSATDHEPVEASDDHVGGPHLVERRQQHGHPTGRLHRGGVLRGQDVGTLLPHPPGRFLAVGGQADEGSAHSGVT